MKDFDHTTIVFPRRNRQVLLGMKKRGLGEGFWNGFGGKLNPEESFEDSARREALEEAGIHIADLSLVAKLLFFFDEELRIAAKAYITYDFQGTPQETDEMAPRWFYETGLPLDQMWPGDKRWIPIILLEEAEVRPIELAIFFNTAGDKFELDRIQEPGTMLVDRAFEL